MTSSILHAEVPYKSSPHLPISERFRAWHEVVNELIKHFKAISNAEAAHNKELSKVAQSVPDPFSRYEYFGENGSIQAIGTLLSQHVDGRVADSRQIIQAIDDDIIPDLQDTESLLSEKVKEISAMSGDFKNNLESGLAASRDSLVALQAAITDWEANAGSVAHNKDPFLVDLETRKNLRSSLDEEDYLHESTSNLSISSKTLEAQVVSGIRRALAKFNNYVSQEAADLARMSQVIEDKIVNGQLDKEWDAFEAKQIEAGQLVDTNSKIRSLESMSYQGKDHISTSPLCDGWLEKKSKLLPTYTTAFYIISPSRYLHEFRSNDLRVDTVPSFSLYLPDCELGQTSKADESIHKFVLKGTQAGGLHGEHNWTFRAKTREDMLAWYANIGKAADTAFSFSIVSASLPHDPAVAKVAAIPLESDEADKTPFQGPETLVVVPATSRRPAAGRFDSTRGFVTPLAAAAAGLNAQSALAPVRRESESGREATTSYGDVRNSSPVPVATYAEHDEHVRQASAHSSAAGFMDKEILDDNAYLEYDKAHGTHSTLVGDEEFRPADADATVSRANSVKGNGYRPRRSSSLAFKELPGSAVPLASSQGRKARPAGKAPSRKATATYGDLSNLPLPAMSELNEVPSPEPRNETYQSPYFPAPGAGTTGALPPSHFNRQSTSDDNVMFVQPGRSSLALAGSSAPTGSGQPRAPQRKMSLSDQIMFATGNMEGASASRTSLASIGSPEVHADLEPNALLAMGTHGDASSPYPANQRFKVPRSRQASLLVATHEIAEPIEAYDVAPHMRVGTQSNEARYKVGSRRGSRSASGVATPLDAGGFERSALDSLSSDKLAAKFKETASGEPARVIRTPSRGASMNLDDGQTSSSPAFNVNQKHQFRKAPSRGSSLSLAGVLGGSGDTTNILNTISETFEKDLAAAKGNQLHDTHTPGDYPQTPGESVPGST